ncbi:hypothetical protein PFISCL1PPCAC_5080, partial [Pristionchus fissidentatus]
NNLSYTYISIIHLHETVLHEPNHHLPRSIGRFLLVSHARHSHPISVWFGERVKGESVLDVRPVSLASVHLIVESGNLILSNVRVCLAIVCLNRSLHASERRIRNGLESSVEGNCGSETGYISPRHIQSAEA